VIRVFVSYRRSDSSGHVIALCKDLTSRFGQSAIFKDVDTIPPGVDFVEAIEEGVDRSQALLAVIGPNWLAASSEGGARRLDDPSDFVRLEIQAALARRELRVIPLLVGGATMPGANELPIELARLARRNAIELRDNRWEADVASLIRALEAIPPLPAHPAPPPSTPEPATSVSAGTPPSRPSPRSERLQNVTVLVTEWIGADGLRQRLTRDEADSLIEECRSAVAHAVEPYGGSLQDGGSDGVTVTFGLPIAHEDDPERAVRAAVRICDSIATLAADLQTAWEVQGFGVRVGITTRRVFTVGGRADLIETVEEASVLAGDAGSGQIYLSRGSTERLGHLFQLEPIGTGAAGRSRLARTHASTQKSLFLTPMAGRDQELAALHRCVENLQAGVGGVLGIVGEAGIGKTRLVHELRAMLGSDVTWLGGRCLSYGATMAYWPVIEALRNYLGVTDGEADVAVKLRLRARLSRLLGDQVDDVFPFFGRLLSVRLDSEHEERVRLPPEALAEQIHRAYRLFVEALAAKGPVVVAVEDLHWADPSTAVLAESLIPVTEIAGVLVVADFRPEPTSQAWHLRGMVQTEYPHRATELFLRPLPPPEARALATSFLGDDDLDEPTLAAVIKRAEGNPLYLEQLLLALLKTGAQEPDLRSGVIALSDLPPAIEDLLVARIDQLSPTARQLVQVAALAGHSFLHRVLERVADDPDLESDIMTLVRANVLREMRRVPELEYVFCQHMAQEAAASTITPSRRRHLHTRLAAVLEELFGDKLDDYAEVLAHHCTEAGDLAKALEYTERAGVRAEGLYANAQAFDWWERARVFASCLGDDAARRRLTRRLADLHARIGDVEAAQSGYRELAADSTDPDEAATLLAEAAWTVLDDDDFKTSRALSADALALSPTQAASRAAVTVAQVRAAWCEGDLKEMSVLLEELETVATAGLSPELESRRIRMWDTYYSRIEDFERAAAWEARLLQLAEAQGDPYQAILAQKNLGITRIDSGDPRAGRKVLQAAFELAQRVGYTPELVKVGCNLLYAHYLLGNISEGVALGSVVLEKARSPRFRALTLVNVGWLKMEAGRTTDARVHFAEALQCATAAGVAWLVAEATIALAATDVAESRLAGATEALRGALDRPETLPSDRIQARRFLAELADGDPNAVEQEARAGLEEKVSEAEKVPLWRLLGQALERRQTGHGREALEQALALSRQSGRRLEEARALVALARAGLTPDPEAAMAAARTIIEICGSEGDLAALG
jgi:tetratricopeptide (TPR) repeat protein